MITQGQVLEQILEQIGNVPGFDDDGRVAQDGMFGHAMHDGEH